MPVFSKEQRVSNKANLSKRGRIDYVHPIHGGYQFYDVVWDDRSSETLLETEILEEIIINTPWDLFRNNSFGDYRNFSIASTAHKVKNTTSNIISTLKSSRTIFKPYQFKPLLKFLRSDIKRILIADEVGLGKTIEAGHILLEQAARNNLKNALIICTTSLCEKWKTELKEKFNFTFKIYESTKEFINDININIAAGKRDIFGIINYEKCRNSKLRELLEKNAYTFDLLICDEAHKVRNNQTEQHNGVAKFVERSEGVLFLTATPIMTNLSNLYYLLKLLDPERFDSYDIFQNAVNQNKPFIRALSQINQNLNLRHIADELDQASIKQEVSADEEVFFSENYTVADLFQNDQLYQRARKRMLSGDNSITSRVEIQNDLIELNSLNNIYTRTRKRDVQTKNEVVKRSPVTLKVKLNQQELEVLDAAFGEYDDKAPLGLMMKKRQVASCIPAYLEDERNLENGIFETEIKDSKFNVLKKILNEIVGKNNKKIIVFAYFKKTLFYLKIKLDELGIKNEIIYGDIKDRNERIENFRTNKEVHVLLSSEVGSEGLDLQFCDALVNYDLPWNPMVVEQRIGRIDRVGQQSQVINIYNLVLTNTIEQKIYDRLFERINLFKESIGDLEDILGEDESAFKLIRSGMEKLYTTRLSEEQQLKILDEIAKAIYTEKQTLEKIKEGLQESFANEFYFQTEIENIEKNRRYLSKNEIILYIESIIRSKLSVFRLDYLNDFESKLFLPKNDSKLLFDFIEEFKDPARENPELENNYFKFKIKYYGETVIPVTFDQQYAFINKNIEFISAFHPLINAITNYYQSQNLDKNQAFKVAVQKEKIDDPQINEGFYVLSQYRLNIHKILGDGKTHTFYKLLNALVDLNGDELVVLPDLIAEKINSIIQESGKPMLTEIPFNPESVDEIRTCMSRKIMEEQYKIKEDEILKFKSAVERRAKQEIEYLQKRIHRMENQINTKQGITSILKSQVEKFTERMNKIKDNVQNSRVEVNHTLISVNLIEVL